VATCAITLVFWFSNDKPLSAWETELADIIETFPNVVAHFSGHFHGGPGKAKDGVLFDTLAGTVSANPDLNQNIWYELEFYDDHVVVDQFGENYYLEPDEDDWIFFFRDHTAAPVCAAGEDCLTVAFADLNTDGDVDGNDLNLWQANFGLQTGATLDSGDAEGDLDVDGSDFLVWQRRVGGRSSTQGSSLQTIPEPSAVVLLSGLATLLLLAKWG